MMVTSRFSQLASINPTVKLEKGKEYPFIDMSQVSPGKRYVFESMYRTYRGGGSKFIEGDTIFARITPCLENGKIAQYRSVGSKFAFGSTEFFVFRAIEDMADPSYIYYLAKSDLIKKPAEKSMSGASGRQRADIKSIANLNVPDPPLHVQRKIAAILSAYDDLIENNLRRIKILEEMGQALYREWFVHFRFPGHEKIRLVDSPLGKIPKGWEVKRIDEIVTFQNQSTDSGYHLSDRVYLPIECLPRKSLAVQETKSWEDAQSSLHMFDERDILFGAMRPYFHKVVISPFRGVTRKTCFVFRNYAEDYHAFVALTLFQDSTVAYASSHSKGATIPYAVWPGSMDGMPVITPPPDIAGMYENAVGPMIEELTSIYYRNKNLRNTRDLLLPKLITGEVDVSCIDIRENDSYSQGGD